MFSIFMCFQTECLGIRQVCLASKHVYKAGVKKMFRKMFNSYTPFLEWSWFDFLMYVHKRNVSNDYLILRLSET